MLLKASLHPYAAVRDVAAAALAGACKRLPCLAPACLPHYLRALAGLPLPSDESLAAALGLPDPAMIRGAQAGGGQNPKTRTRTPSDPDAVHAGGGAAVGEGSQDPERRSGAGGGSGGGARGGTVGGERGDGREGLGSGRDAPVVPAALLAALRQAVARPAARAAAGETTAAGTGPAACAYFTCLRHAALRQCYAVCTKRAWTHAENAVEEGLVGGAATAMCAQPFYRLLARQPAALAAVVAALLASGGHCSPRSTAAVGHYALQLIVSFIRPPALAEAQVGGAHKS